MKHSRWLEDLGFVAAVFVGVYAGVKEANAMHVAGAQHPFPWALLIIMAILAAPKTLGRASAGTVWTAIASRFGVKPPAGPTTP